MNATIVKDKDGDIWEPVAMFMWECRTEDAPNLSYAELKLYFGPLKLFGFEGEVNVERVSHVHF